MDMNDNVLEECEILVPWHARVSVLFVAQVVRAGLVVGYTGGFRLAGECVSGDVFRDDAVVGVVVGEIEPPWRRRRSIAVRRMFPRSPVVVGGVLYAEHVEFGCVSTIFVVERVRFVVGNAVRFITVRSTTRDTRLLPALATYLATVVIHRVVLADARYGDDARVGLCAVGLVVVVHEPRG